MSATTLTVLLLNFLFIGALPVVFFKKGGRFNLRWWLTAAPFWLCSPLLVADFFGLFAALTGYRLLPGGLLELVGVGCATASIALIAFTVGTHRRPVALWHQEHNQPEQLITQGAYWRIRHPFYAAFLLALLGAFLASPQAGTLFTLAYGFAVLNYTAAQEERQLLASPLGEQYAEYRQRTGRFWPRLDWRKA